MTKQTNQTKGTGLITGASSGIGAIYADRLARRGHDLILVARNQERLDTLATNLTDDTKRSVDVVVADLSKKADLARVEKVLRTDESITTLVSNAGVATAGTVLETDVQKMDDTIALNVSALTRLTYAAVPGFVARGGGTIINVASILAIAPELFNAVYGGTKAFVLTFTLALHKELAEKHVRVQAVLPGATATDIWAKSGMSIDQLPSEIVMKADEMVDAALAGLDQGEVITLPSLPDYRDWQAYESARQKLIPNLSRNVPAPRYRAHQEILTTSDV
jgi:uncharacterized protein